MIGKIICWMLRQHRWAKPTETLSGRRKVCLRCGLERQVKMRVKKNAA